MRTMICLAVSTTVSSHLYAVTVQEVKLGTSHPYHVQPIQYILVRIFHLVRISESMSFDVVVWQNTSSTWYWVPAVSRAGLF